MRRLTATPSALLAVGGLAIAAGAGAATRSSSLAVAPDGRLLAVANTDSDSLTLPDTETLAVLAEVAVGRSPRAVAIDSTGARAFVTSRLDDSLTIVDLARWRVVARRTADREPGGVVAGADGRVLRRRHRRRARPLLRRGHADTARRRRDRARARRARPRQRRSHGSTSPTPAATGASGNGMASPLTTDTGTFWFFGPTNVEVVVKVLDACGFPGAPRFWVFAAGLTDVEVTLIVADTATGAVKTYSNPLGTAFRPVQDTATFATCL